jgi:hypothetical protein
LLLSAEATAGDEADLPEEYAILNLSIFMADAGDEAITDKYVYQSSVAVSSPSPDCLGCRQVKLPLDPAALARKDIYVIANYDNIAQLNAVQTVADLQALTTSRLRNEVRLSTTRGLPMYGESLDIDLTDTASDPPHIRLARTCAKIQVDLLFTDASWIGTNNYFRVENVAPYTYFVPNADFSISVTDLIEYPQVFLNQQTGSPQCFSGVAYIYESTRVPHITLYTVVGGKAREYVLSTNFPLPTRNRMYHILVEIYPPLPGATRGGEGEIQVSSVLK